jgi:hypothetical protein
MQSVYLITLVGVAVAIVAALVEAIAALRRPRVWQTARMAAPSTLELVETVDRRERELAFVGAERRRAGAAVEADAPATVREAA